MLLLTSPSWSPPLGLFLFTPLPPSRHRLACAAPNPIKIPPNTSVRPPARARPLAMLAAASPWRL
ncbi:hypothetical protein DAI22_11g012950 [Oryza sativa Japonica Group]|nr:hypothetical protein DAI22_11g012950 [Oryza sativa Japonica Group]